MSKKNYTRQWLHLTERWSSTQKHLLKCSGCLLLFVSAYLIFCLRKSG